MKFLLPNGMAIVPETPEETAMLLRNAGFSAPVAVAPAAPVATQSSPVAPNAPDHPWSRGNAAHFLDELGDGPTRTLVDHLMQTRRPAVTTDVAQALHLEDAKPLGSMVATIRRVATTIGLPAPIISEVTPDGKSRVFRLDAGFRAALEDLARKAP